LRLGRLLSGGELSVACVEGLPAVGHEQSFAKDSFEEAN
jgi:hypothetical protein